MSYDPNAGEPAQPQQPPVPPQYQPPGAVPPVNQPPAPQQPTYQPQPGQPQPGYTQPGYTQPGYGAPQPGQPQAPQQPPYVGYAQQPAYSPQGYPVTSYPGYGAAPGQLPNPGVGGLAIAAIIVSGVAFLSGWIPIVGVVLALVGLVLSILAIRSGRGKVLGIIGTILAGIALLFGAFMTTMIFVVAPWNDTTSSSSDPWSVETPSAAPDDGAFDEAEAAAVSGQLIETPCWSYDGPKHFTDNISAEEAGNCYGQLELWGEYDESGNFVPTGYGETAGQITVEPVSSATAAQYSDGADLSATVDALEKPYLSTVGGTISSLHEETTLGGVPANITRIDSDVAETQMKVVLTTFSPQPYDIGGDQRKLFLISITTPYSNGEEQLQQLLDSWEWR